MSEHDWTVESEADGRSSRIGWFAAGALAALVIGMLVMAATVFDWASGTEVAADTPPVIIEEY